MDQTTPSNDLLTGDYQSLGPAANRRQCAGEAKQVRKRANAVDGSTSKILRPI